ncbi:MFS family permease [Kibdelosporangium banguiense]|uniref:MFS family permease n=1 Tax=Kibdelosporangium banguiense TaxID=1365924 RepID=A0ABS4TX40_9PSEU|nr:MFS transporter [Kibdelosporangium banguiense]MBP2328942.1 MFS family permease [Kibdelosporangium banguiense]
MESVTPRGLPRRPYVLVLIALIAAEATSAFELSMLSAAVPDLMAEFRLQTTDIGWAFTGFMLVIAASAAVGGKLGDLFGRKKVLIVVLLLSILGSVVSVAFGTFGAIIAGRAIQGVTGAILPCIMGIAREAVEPKRVQVTMAVVAGTVTIAGALGFFFSGLLIQYANWHSIFIAAAVLAGLAALLCQILLAPSPRTYVRGDKIDIVGGALFVPALAAILYSVTESQTSGWGDPVVLGGIAIGVVVGVFWVWWELRVPKPLLNLRLLAKPRYALTMCIVAFVSFGAFGGIQLVQPILFQSPTSMPIGLGLTPSVFGMIGLAIAGFGFLFAPVSGMVAGRVGAKRSMLIGIVGLAVTMPSYFLFRDSLVLMILVMVLGSVGTMFAVTSIPTMMAEVVPPENMGEGMGFSVVVRSLFQAISVSVFSLTLSSAVVPGTALPTVGAYGLTMAVGAVGTLVALLLVLLMRGRPAATGVIPGAAPLPALAQD